MARAGPKRAKARSKETEALKKISSMVNRSLELPAILASALETSMALFEVNAGIFRLRATPEVPARSVHRGFHKETAALLEAMIDEASTQQWVPAPSPQSPLGNALSKDNLHFLGIYPIRSGNRSLGTIALAGEGSRTVSPAQEEFIEALS